MATRAGIEAGRRSYDAVRKEMGGNPVRDACPLLSLRSHVREPVWVLGVLILVVRHKVTIRVVVMSPDLAPFVHRHLSRQRKRSERRRALSHTHARAQRTSLLQVWAHGKMRSQKLWESSSAIFLPSSAVGACHFPSHLPCSKWSGGLCGQMRMRLVSSMTFFSSGTHMYEIVGSTVPHSTQCGKSQVLMKRHK